MKGNLAGTTWNQLIVNKFSFTLRQQDSLHYVVCTVIMICIMLLIRAFVLYHIIGSIDFAIGLTSVNSVKVFIMSMCSD